MVVYYQNNLGVGYIKIFHKLFTTSVMHLSDDLICWLDHVFHLVSVKISKNLTFFNYFSIWKKCNIMKVESHLFIVTLNKFNAFMNLKFFLGFQNRNCVLSLLMVPHIKKWLVLLQYLQKTFEYYQKWSHFLLRFCHC